MYVRDVSINAHTCSRFNEWMDEIDNETAKNKMESRVREKRNRLNENLNWKVYQTVMENYILMAYN